MRGPKCFLRNNWHPVGMIQNASIYGANNMGEILPIGRPGVKWRRVRAWLGETFVATHWKRWNPQLGPVPTTKLDAIKLGMLP